MNVEEFLSMLQSEHHTGYLDPVTFFEVFGINGPDDASGWAFARLELRKRGWAAELSPNGNKVVVRHL